MTYQVPVRTNVRVGYWIKKICLYDRGNHEASISIAITIVIGFESKHHKHDRRYDNDTKGKTPRSTAQNPPTHPSVRVLTLVTSSTRETVYMSNVRTLNKSPGVCIWHDMACRMVCTYQVCNNPTVCLMNRLMGCPHSSKNNPVGWPTSNDFKRITEFWMGCRELCGLSHM